MLNFNTNIIMKEQSNYVDNALIKLKRIYSKDETVNALSKKLKSTLLELGKVKSERDEALYFLEEKEQLNQEIVKLKEKISAQEKQYQDLKKNKENTYFYKHIDELIKETDIEEFKEARKIKLVIKANNELQKAQQKANLKNQQMFKTIIELREEIKKLTYKTNKQIV